MDTYIVVNRHAPDDCPVLFRAVRDDPWDRQLAGTPFLCTRPSGDHGGTFAVEAASPEQALALVDRAFRGHSRALRGHLYVIGDSPELPVR